MRIVFVHWRDLDHPQAGGAEVVLDQLATGLQARGHDVELLAGTPVGSRPYPVRPIGGTYSQYLRAPFTFWRSQKNVDVVVDVENGVPYFSPLWQRAPVVCLVHHVHTDQWRMQFPAPVAAFGRWLESTVMPRVYRRASFVAVSASTRDGLVELGVPAAQIRTIEMGSPRVEAIGPRAAEPRFLVLGRLVPHKQVEVALRLWEQVRPRTGGHLVVVGDGPELGRLREHAGAAVEFTGRVSEAQKARELGGAWLLVHPAHHEGWGTVVMEAAAAGLPTVAFDVPGVRDSLVDGVTGLLADDEPGLADAWVRLATDTALRERMGNAARERAASFTWDRAVKEFEAALIDAAES